MNEVTMLAQTESLKERLLGRNTDQCLFIDGDALRPLLAESAS